MRRSAPRRIGSALDGLVTQWRPPTTLARIQEVWPEVAGPGLSEGAQPVAERGGVVTVACRSSVWAQELELFSPELRVRLNEAIGGPGPGQPVAKLRFVTTAGERVL
jgi:predicted nucleic acid-binding Zn ribbon protein